MGNPSEDEQAAAAPDSTAGGAKNGDQPSSADTTPTNDPAALLTQLNTLVAERDQPETEETEAPAEEETVEDQQETVEETEEQQEETPLETEDLDDKGQPKAATPKDDEKGKQFRHRAKDDQEEAFHALLKAGKSIPEATAAVYGKGAEAPTQQQEQTTTVTDPVALAQQEVETIEADLNEAERNFDADKAADLRKQLRAAERKLVTAEVKAEQAAESQQQTAVTAHATALDSSTASAIGMFPDIAKEGSPLYEAIEDRIAEKKRSNPDFFNDPEWPLTLAAEQALKLGILPVKSTAAPAKPAALPPKTAVQKPPAKVTRPVAIAPSTSGGARSEVTSPEEVDLDHEAKEAKASPIKGMEFLARHGQPVLAAR